MSRLYASIDSDARKTLATSRGHKHVDTHTRGWTSGVRVVARAEGDEDVFDIYLTGGSGGYSTEAQLGTLRGETFHPKHPAVFAGQSEINRRS